MKYIYILILSLSFTQLSAQFDVKLNVDNTNKRLRVLIRNTVSSAPTTSQNISSINMKLLGSKVGNIISIHSGDYTIQMPNPDSIITMSSVSLPSPINWTQNQWYPVVVFNLTPGMEYTTMDFSVQPDLDMDNSDVFDAIMSVQAAGLFNIPLNIMSTTLPVRLSRFDVTSYDDYVDCQWTTESEVNNWGFEVQRSADGSEFEKLGWVDGTTNSNQTIHYEFKDRRPSSGYNYYRLKQIDLDGKYWYSEIKKAYFKSKKREVSIYPNPTSETLFIDGLESGKSISIFSNEGRLIGTYSYSNNGIDLSSFTTGLYLVSFYNGTTLSSKSFFVN